MNCVEHVCTIFFNLRKEHLLKLELQLSSEMQNVRISMTTSTTMENTTPITVTGTKTNVIVNDENYKSIVDNIISFDKRNEQVGNDLKQGQTDYKKSTITATITTTTI